MENRKLIKFGNSSFVISLPRKWIEKNKLEKGDTIFLEESINSELLIQPRLKETKKEDKEIVINIENKEFDRIQREIISAYINSYNIIRIKGKDLHEKEKRIKDTIHNLMALEIIEGANNLITAKDFLDYRTISPGELLRKMDIIVRSMFIDLRSMLFGQKLLEHIRNRDEDLNRIFFLISRIYRYSMTNPLVCKIINIEPKDIITIMEVSTNLERIGDSIKRSAREINKIDQKILSEFSQHIQNLELFYLECIGSFFKKNQQLAFELSSKKNDYLRKSDELYSKYWDKKYVPNLIQNLRYGASSTHNIVRTIYV